MPVLDQRPEVALDRIVVGTDFSGAAETAVCYAAALARRYSAELDVVNVLDLSLAAVSAEGSTGTVLEAMKQSSAAGLAACAQRFPDVRIRTKLQEGISSCEGLRAVVKETDAGLLVLGTASKRGLNKLIFGSTAEDMIREAPCPVLTVGPHVENRCDEAIPFRRIVCADDLSDRANKALSYALLLAEDSGAHLYLCHVLEGEDSPVVPLREIDLQQRMRALVPHRSGEWCTTECTVQSGNASAEILKLAEQVKADVIVLGPRHGSFWLKYVNTGTTPAILAEARCPVLTVC